ncbi:MAG TPA: ATP synthase F1 subunit delta [Planctomycetota bacterium]|nr:ATP synthase F1 subunit delta [Planctomycetota bacterium]
MASKESGAIAAVYAQALFDVAKDADVVERVEQELRALDEMVRKEVTFRRFLETPTVSIEDKAKVLKEALSSFQPIVLNFLFVGLQNSRIPGVLSGTIENYHNLWLQHTGVAELDVRTARKLDEAELEGLKKVMQQKLGRKVALRENVDPKVLGGLVVSHNDTQWDTTVASRLSALIARMKETKFTAELIAKEG